MSTTMARTSFDFAGFLAGSLTSSLTQPGSVGANRAEARSAYTNKDFASKNAICLKEAREALFWLRVAEAKALGNVQRRHALMKEANELVSIFVAVIRSLQTKSGAG